MDRVGLLQTRHPFIDPVTREKLKFNEDMKQYVPPEQLWSADWGGDMDFEYDHAVYWPALNDLCRERREEKLARWTAAGEEIGESEVYLAGGTDVSVTGHTYVAKAVGGEAETMVGETNGNGVTSVDVDVVQEKLADTKLDGAAVGDKDAEKAPVNAA